MIGNLKAEMTLRNFVLTARTSKPAGWKIVFLDNRSFNKSKIFNRSKKTAVWKKTSIHLKTPEGGKVIASKGLAFSF